MAADLSDGLAALLAAGTVDGEQLYAEVERAEEVLDGELLDEASWVRLKALADEALARAAEQGHPFAAVTVASRIYFGRHDDRAPEAFALAARAEDVARGQYLLGLFRYAGFGCPVDLPASFAHHRNAAEGGDPDAMFELYVFHSRGIAVPQDDAAAMAWCVRAAEAGSARAMANLGSFYATGHGMPRDEVEAIGWYYRAAEAGHGKAAATIGVMCALGQGTEPSEEEAKRWLQVAREIGFEPWSFVEQCGLDPVRYLA